MPNIINSVDWHWANLRLSAGVDIQYSSQGAAPVTIEAVKGRRRTEITGADFIETVVSDEFIVRPEDLTTAGIPEPFIGDTIVWVDGNSVSRTCEVLLPGTERQYDPMDLHHKLIRVHAKEMVT